MFAIYLIVAIIILAYSFYYAGQWEPNPKGEWHFFDDEADIVKCGFGVALFWPIVIALTIFIGPFGFLFYIGQKRKEKRKVNK